MSSPTTPNAGDLPFRHYSLKHRVVAWISRNLFDSTVYTVRHGLIAGMKRKGGLGWIPTSGGDETAEERFWRSLDLSGKVVYDVGAFQGLLTLWFSRTAQRVVSFEPASVNRARLLDNLRLNDVKNVTVRPHGLGSKTAQVNIVYSQSMPGGASADSRVSAQTQQMASDARSEVIEVRTLDDIRNELPPPDLIKIDVEGLELDVLLGAQRTLAEDRPALFLEMHGDTMNEKKRKVHEIVSFLNSAGYSDVRHVESGQQVTAADSDIAAEGHLYCSASR
jgi:FkbM family methyltransferase